MSKEKYLKRVYIIIPRILTGLPALKTLLYNTEKDDKPLVQITRTFTSSTWRFCVDFMLLKSKGRRVGIKGIKDRSFCFSTFQHTLELCGVYAIFILQV